MEKSASTRYVTRAEELLSAMSNEEVKPETEKPRRTFWQNILMTCFCILIIAAAGKGFLYLENGISTVESAVGSAVKDLNTIKAQVTAADAKDQLAAVTAEIGELKATNIRRQAEMEQIREAFETLKARKQAVVSAQQKRR